MRKHLFAHAHTKVQISCVVTARAADQRLCLQCITSTINPLPKSKILNIVSSSVAVQPGFCRTWFEAPDSFSLDAAHFMTND